MNINHSPTHSPPRLGRQSSAPQLFQKAPVLSMRPKTAIGLRSLMNIDEPEQQHNGYISNDPANNIIVAVRYVVLLLFTVYCTDV
jgi:hypothetical protein